MTNQNSTLSDEELAELDGIIIDENGRLRAETLKYYMGGKPNGLDEE